MTDGKKILIGRNEIMEYIGVSAPQLFYDWVKNGLPARAINRRWYAHRDNLDNFFKAITLRSDGNVDITAE